MAKSSSRQEGQNALSWRMRDRVEFDGNSPLEKQYVEWVREFADKVAQLEAKNERLRDGIQKIVTTFYPVMYDNDKVGLALVALLNDALKEGNDAN